MIGLRQVLHEISTTESAATVVNVLISTCSNTGVSTRTLYKTREPANTAQTMTIMRLARRFVSSDFLFPASDGLRKIRKVKAENTVATLAGARKLNTKAP